jgi:cell wall-associated NlpC family hydrolase
MFSQVPLFKPSQTPKLRPRKRMFAAVMATLVLGLGAFQPAFALNSETAAPADDMQALLISKGILSKIGGQIVQKGEQIVNVGQSVTQSVVQQVGQQVSQVSERTGDLVSTAIGFLGIPYLRGGNSAETGFDCSGFVRAIYKETIGLVLPRSADQQASATQKIDRSELKPGDLVFFNTMKRTFSHVGIYLGEGKFIHSPRSGSSVRIEDMRIPYWNVRFDGARRVQGDGMDAAKVRAVSAATVTAAGTTALSTSADIAPVR